YFTPRTPGHTLLCSSFLPWHWSSTLRHSVNRKETFGCSLEYFQRWHSGLIFMYLYPYWGCIVMPLCCWVSVGKRIIFPLSKKPSFHSGCSFLSYFHS